jgi:hypothetical protein
LLIVATKKTWDERDFDVLKRDENGIVITCWDLLVDMVVAAALQEEESYRNASTRAARELSVIEQRALGVYLTYALRTAVLLRVGHYPKVNELAVLTQSILPAVSRNVLTDEEVVLDTIKTVYEVVGPDREVVRGNFLVMSPAILSAVLEKPIAELSLIRNSFARWLQKHTTEFRVLVVGT